MSNSGEIEVGDIFKIAADEENGITPPGGRDVWYKHFVVIGKTSDGSVYGCVVFRCQGTGQWHQNSIMV